MSGLHNSARDFNEDGEETSLTKSSSGAPALANMSESFSPVDTESLLEYLPPPNISVLSLPDDGLVNFSKTR